MKRSRAHALWIILLALSECAFGYDAVFYCTYQSGECVPGQSAIGVDPEDMGPLLERVMALEENFIGFVDREDTTIQFFVDAPDRIWMEIPVPEEQGSYGIQMSADETKSLIEMLEAPYMDYRKRLNLPFVPW